MAEWPMRWCIDASHRAGTLTRIGACVEEDEAGHAAIGIQSERRPWTALALVVTAQFMVILHASPLRLLPSRGSKR
jgi:hypothetical protein